MEVSVSKQLIEMAASICFGAAAAFLYDIFRTIRYVFKLKRSVHIMDGLYWIICSCCLFLLGLTLGEGRQRMVMTVLAFVGGGIYFAAFSRYALPLLEKCAGLLINAVKIAWSPVRKFVNLLKKMRENLKNLFHYNAKCYRIDKKYKKAERKLSSKHGGSIDETQTFRYSYENIADRLAGVRGVDSCEHERKNHRRHEKSGRS